jgi:hypothetical protein
MRSGAFWGIQCGVPRPRHMATERGVESGEGCPRVAIQYKASLRGGWIEVEHLVRDLPVDGWIVARGLLSAKCVERCRFIDPSHEVLLIIDPKCDWVATELAFDTIAFNLVQLGVFGTLWFRECQPAPVKRLGQE